MYCGQCGKKVMDNMLFCPFCGSPIVIPDQDEASTAAPKEQLQAEPVRMREDAQGRAVSESPFGAEDATAEQRAPEESAPVEEFVPLRFDFDAPDPETEPAPAPAPEPVEAPHVEDAPEPAPQKRRPVARRPVNERKRSANTFIPVKEMDMDDIFLDGGDQEDDYDLDEGYEDDYGDGFDYEERESGGFFQRHIRGIVALILMLILLVVCAAWAISPKGQLVLAQVNLAWSAEAYADLGYDAYQKDADLLAARYYERAFERDPDNYEYAHSAMVAYYEADKIDSAAAMLKKCVDLDPDNPEPYEEMLILYPDAESRPWEITELVRMGYQRTGAESLKLE